LFIDKITHLNYDFYSQNYINQINQSLGNEKNQQVRGALNPMGGAT
jgi:hypothetical protein